MSEDLVEVLLSSAFESTPNHDRNKECAYFRPGSQISLYVELKLVFEAQYYLFSRRNGNDLKGDARAILAIRLATRSKPVV
jgi:hypothetical protein